MEITQSGGYQDDAPTSGGDQPIGLSRSVLTPLETLAQSVAGIAPSATPGILIPIVFGFAGNGTWLSYVLATVGIMFTAKCINAFASRSACPGSLYTFVGRGIGLRAGLLTGWALVFAYVVCVATCITEVALYAHSLTKEFFHLQMSEQGMMFVCTGLVAFVAYKNIKMSASLMLRLEFISMTLITILVLWTLGKHGAVLDQQQLSLSGVRFENVRMGLVMAIFGFAAFESSASLGTESSNPLQTIPQAITRSLFISGVFFVVSAYTIVMSFHGLSISLDKCPTPLLEMSTLLGAPGLGHLIDVGILFSFFAATLANLNAGARLIYKMSADGLLNKGLSDVHPTNRTPHSAVAVTSGIGLALAVLLADLNFQLMDIIGWLGTLATFGFISVYLAISVAAALFLRRTGELTAGKLFVVAASISVLLCSLVGSLCPVPVFPYSILPWIFLAYMVGGLLGSFKLVPIADKSEALAAKWRGAEK